MSGGGRPTHSLGRSGTRFGACRGYFSGQGISFFTVSLPTVSFPWKLAARRGPKGNGSISCESTTHAGLAMSPALSTAESSRLCR